MPDRSLPPELCDKVFGNQLLLEKILGFVVFDGVNLSRKDIQTCRLVQRNWLEATSVGLLKARAPVFSIDFVEYTFPTPPGLPGERDVNSFLDTWGISSTGEGNPVFPFDLELRPRHRINGVVVTEFINCLVNCGKSVVSIFVTMTFDHLEGETGSFEFPGGAAQMQLPNLKWVRVELSGEKDPLATLLLQHIFAGSERLESVVVEYHRDVSTITKPGSFQCPHFPPTLKTLEIGLTLTSGRLESLLLKHSHPNLSDLAINMIPKVTDNWSQLISQMLTRFRLKLKKLTFGGTSPVSPALSFDKLPVMPQLQYLCVDNSNYIWAEGWWGMESFFPAVDTLILCFDNSSRFQNWMQNSRLDTVKKVAVKVEHSREAPQFTETLSDQINKTFPHAVDLTIDFPGTFKLVAVQHIFMAMGRLEKLDFRIKTTDGTVGPEYWDAILLGITPGFAKHLREDGSLWETFYLGEREDVLPSIGNLKELRSLSLRSDSNNGGPLISEISFRYALRLMKKLKEVNLLGDFKPSEEMKMEMTGGDRDFDYSHWDDN